MSENSSENFNIFISNEIYPDPEAIFNVQLKSLDEIKESAIVVLDTNALLVPYTISPKSLGEIKETYQHLVSETRLKIPGQVGREFAKQRAKKLSELYQQLSNKLNNLPQLQRGKYPLLENLQVYNKAISTEKDIDDLLSEYKKTINKVLQAIRSWTWNDPVSSMYANLFDESVIVDPDFDRDKLSKELKRRNIHKIPPGYKDSSKDDKGIGDLLIWFTILQIGKNNNKSIIFVSGDEKADWWYQSQGRSLYPRFELVDEFRRHSKGKSFHIVSFSMLLDTYGASPDVISEVREKESQSLSEMTHGELHILELCQQGYTNSEIADITGLSSGTVRNYLSKIYSKLDARNRVEAIQSAIEAEILDPFAVDDSKINKIKSRSTQEIMMRQMDISARELEILELMKLGLTNNEISAKLNIGEGTTRNYTSSIYNKLDVRNKVEAIQEAIEIGLIPPIAE